MDTLQKIYPKRQTRELDKEWSVNTRIAVTLPNGVPPSHENKQESKNKSWGATGYRRVVTDNKPCSCRP